MLECTQVGMHALADAVRQKALPRTWMGDGTRGAGKLLLKFNPGRSSFVDAAVEQMQHEYCK